MIFGKNLTAKFIAKQLRECKTQVYAALFIEDVGSEYAAVLVSEAQHFGFLGPDYKINSRYAPGNYLRTVLDESYDYDKGKEVVIVKNGKTFNGIIADNASGKYKIAFKGESPDDHDENKEYSGTDFGLVDEEE